MHAVGVRHAQCEGPHDGCRDRIGELVAEDDDQKLSECRREQSQRLTSRVRKPERKWTLVNRVVWLDRRTNQLPRLRWDHRVQEPELDQVQEQMKRTQMIVKRNVSDSQRAEARRGKAKTWKNWQRRQKNNILMPMLRCLHTRHWRVEDVVGDAADAAPEQMNSFASEQDRSVRED